MRLLEEMNAADGDVDKLIISVAPVAIGIACEVFLSSCV